jgi:hypothetical protein
MGQKINPPPIHTAASNVSEAVKREDRACILTGALSGLQASYLIPKGEFHWVCSEGNVDV